MRTTTHNEETKGIVLKTMPYKENDLLVTIYSYDFGKITFRARGAKKLTSKNAPSVMSMTYSEYEIAMRPGLSMLVRGSSLNYYKRIKSSIECEIVASYLLEYYYRYVEENKPSLEMFEFIEGVLNALEQGYDFRVLYALINIFIMKQNGVELEVDGCASCGRAQVNAFSLEAGGFVCEEHRRLNDLKLRGEELKAIRYLYKCPIDKIGELHLGDLSKVLPIFEYYIDEYCGVNLKARKFMKQIL